MGPADGVFGAVTRSALIRFQQDANLDDDGICGAQTWSALVDASYSLGDRLLYLSSPMVRGDDVAELQRRLGVLGFDCGRVDGILGPDTETALKDFQRNVGLTPDGICGRDTVTAFRRLSPRSGADSLNVVSLRETERVRAGTAGLRDRLVVVGERGGLDSVTASCRRSLIQHGASVLTIHHPDWSQHATQANNAQADAIVAIEVTSGAPGIAYFAAPGVSSDAGRRLAECAARALSPAMGPLDVRGLRHPVLRETRAPAIVCRFDDAALLVRRAPEVGSALSASLSTWISELISD